MSANRRFSQPRQRHTDEPADSSVAQRPDDTLPPHFHVIGLYRPQRQDPIRALAEMVSDMSNSSTIKLYLFLGLEALLLYTASYGTQRTPDGSLLIPNPEAQLGTLICYSVLAGALSYAMGELANINITFDDNIAAPTPRS